MATLLHLPIVLRAKKKLKALQKRPEELQNLQTWHAQCP